MIRLLPGVLEALRAKGIEPGEEDTPESLKERLNDAYLVEVRRLRERQRSGAIPLRQYAEHADALKQSFALLGLPTDRWVVSG